MNKINLSAYQPITDIQDNIIFANNGNVVLCYEGTLPEIYSLSEKDFEDIHGAWFQALKSLPVGTVVHKQDIYLKEIIFFRSNFRIQPFWKMQHTTISKDVIIWNIVAFCFLHSLKNKALNNPKYVNPFRKAFKRNCSTNWMTTLRSFIGSVSDSVSFINNSRKMEFVPLNANRNSMQLNQWLFQWV